MNYEKIETPINKLEIYEITKEIYQYLKENDLLDQEAIYVRNLEEQMQDVIKIIDWSSDESNS